MHSLITRGCHFGVETSNSDDGNMGDNSSDNAFSNGGGTTTGDNSDTGNGNSSDGQWIDFRKIPLEDLQLEYTDGVQINRDLERGLWASGTGDFFGRGVKFIEYQWKRADELPFSFVFTVRGTNPSFLFGIGRPEIDVNNLGDQALFAGEIQLFYDNGRFNRFFGGGGVRNWAQDTGANIKFQDNVFYKVTFEKSGKVGSMISIYSVASSNFDENIELIGEYVAQDNPTNNPDLIPCWNAVSNPDTFITALGIF